jgi:glycosyltransferase involved in cell wall biosynthesis
LWEYIAFLVVAFCVIAWRSLHFGPPTIIYVHTMPDVLVFAGLVPRLLGSKLVLDVHEPMPELYASKFTGVRGRALYWLVRIQEVVSFAAADAFVTIHHGMAELLAARGGTGRPMCVAMNLPDPRVFPNRQPSPCDSANGPVLFYGGTLAPRYGLDAVVRSMPALLEEYPKTKLMLVGDGDAVASLKRLSMEVGVKRSVEFVGAVRITELVSLLNSADIVVSPHVSDPFFDLYFSTKIVEALLCGKPVVVSKTHTIAQYFDESMVYFIDPLTRERGIVDSVRQILSDPDQAMGRVREAQRVFETMSWEGQQREYLSFLRSLSGPLGDGVGEH